MVRTSGIREKLRSNVLKELARERNAKRPRHIDQDSRPELRDSDEELDDDTLEEERSRRVKSTSNSLLSILPKPKNASPSGPSIKLEELLKMPERDNETISTDLEPASEIINDDGMIEMDISKVVTDNIILPRDTDLERGKPNIVIVPKGKEKQKNQITYLAQLGKANELERKEQAAQSRLNKAAARSKYGW